MFRTLSMALTLAAITVHGAFAEVTLAQIFGDAMVLQRGKPVPVWGQASPNETVTVSLNGKTAKTTADAKGAWSAKLPSMTAGGPYELKVSASSGSPVTLKDVMLGDVWICSGQSNMGMTMQDTVHGGPEFEKELTAANHSNLRLFQVYPVIGTTPWEELGKHTPWQACTPDSVRNFSAAAYFFGRHVVETQKIPVGLVLTAWGGTYAEAWTSHKGLEGLPWFADRLRAADENLPKLGQLESEYRDQSKAWEVQIDALDAGMANSWSKPECATADWKTVDLPHPIAMLAGAGGAALPGGRVWLRRDIELPATWQGKDLVLSLGLVRETSRVWFNGVEVGQFPLTYRFWDGVNASIPGNLVKPGMNSVVIRVTSGGSTALFSDPGNFRLAVKDGSVGLAPVSLAGAWRMNVGLTPDKLTPRPAAPAFWPNNPNMPTVLNNAMIHPLLRTPIKGAIWYQGESNAAAAYEYRELFPTLIRDWREDWHQGDFPFLFVQIANFSCGQPTATKPRECGWAELREAQAMTLATPNTGMAVSIDIGQLQDIHPVNKRDVGLRLGLAAQKVAYHQKLEYSGPVFKSMKVKDGKAYLRFSHADGLTAKGGVLKGFEIAGANRNFEYAKAEVKGNTVVLWNEAVTEPVAVRYGWDYAPECTLYNAAGLPASPFRTDQWPGVTAPKTAEKK